MVCVLFNWGAPEGSTDSGSGEAWDRTCNLWFTRRMLHPCLKADLVYGPVSFYLFHMSGFILRVIILNDDWKIKGSSRDIR